MKIRIDPILLFAIIVLALVLGAVLGVSSHSSRHLIKDCEKELPRTQNCILIAIPEKEL